ncbi:MAG: SpoIID/LytB domain-containing protein [Cyanobacteria bacterium REEB67]|nr:SpoIID/LytB domain-containing protein [Cyanobacteria bacterium REEB67]
MQIWVGITNLELSSLDQGEIVLSSAAPMQASSGGENGDAARALNIGTALKVRIQSGPGGGVSLLLTGNVVPAAELPLFVKSAKPIQVDSLRRAGGGAHPTYPGDLKIERRGAALRLSVRLSLDDYLRGVLSSEMPASYHAEALKCQAVAARTYALNPRISHAADHVNVCDSFLCCQYFAGSGGSVDVRIERAIEATGASGAEKGAGGRGSQILTYQGKPILALFSSNAGGHTENYENCFSDPLTGAFPPPPIPYLAGVPEGRYPGLKPKVGSEDFLRYLFAAKKQNDTAVSADLFSSKFAWTVSIPAHSLEAHLHHAVETLAQARDSAAFVIPPAGHKFGHIKGLEVTERGVSGVAMALKIKTSSGDWTIRKELVIRKAFANPEVKLARLNSARLFFDQSFDALGLLSNLTIHGLGFGHGVGLQQTGAQGFAMQGQTYKQILSHYFPGSELSEV